LDLNKNSIETNKVNLTNQDQDQDQAQDVFPEDQVNLDEY